jgi:hypothetical protein
MLRQYFATGHNHSCSFLNHTRCVKITIVNPVLEPSLMHHIKSACLTILKVGMNLLKICNPKVQALIVLLVINRN